MKRDAGPEVVGYASDGGVPVEAVSLAEIRRKGSARHLAAVQRPSFTMFLLYTEGHGEHVVDFERFAVAPGRLIMVPAGRTHQFRLSSDMQGMALVVDQDFVLPERLSPLRQALSNLDWPVASFLSDAAQEDFIGACDTIRSDSARFRNDPLLPHLLRQRLYALLVLLHLDWSRQARRPAQGHARQADLLRDFRDLVNRHFLDRWTVADYARKLGYAERTLTRACIDLEARTAKRIIDERLALEARRLIANGDDTIDAVAFALRFQDASNLTQFFRRVTGTTPSEFRRLWRAP